MAEILKIYWDSHSTYGAPRITVILNRNGFHVSQKKVSNEMKFLGIASIHTKKFPRKKSSMSQEERAVIHNLIKNLTIDRPNQVWTTDITYIPTICDGTLYLISFIDQFSKRIVGWHLAKTQKATDVIIALNKAINNRKPLPGLICHSDKGSQFRSNSYRNVLADNHLIFSYTSLDHSCDENAAQESFHATLKKEWLSVHTLYHYEDAYAQIYNFIEGFYNPQRIHSSIGYLSPIDFENNYFSQKNS